MMHNEISKSGESKENPMQTGKDFLEELASTYERKADENRKKYETARKSAPSGVIQRWSAGAIAAIVGTKTAVSAEREQANTLSDARIGIFIRDTLELLPPGIACLEFPPNIKTHIEVYISRLDLYTEGDVLKQSMAIHSLIGYLDTYFRHQK